MDAMKIRIVVDIDAIEDWRTRNDLRVLLKISYFASMSMLGRVTGMAGESMGQAGPEPRH